MKQDQIISDEFLNAFVDDQLDSAEKNRVFELIEQNEALKTRVCELRGLKEMVRHTYLQAPLPSQEPARASSKYRAPLFQALAASVLLIIGATSGWFAHSMNGYGSDREVMRLLQAVQRNDIGADPHKLMIHVGTSNPVRLETALDEAENLLASSRQANRPMQVEIIANGGGVVLLRDNVSIYAQRIKALQGKYPNLDLVACGQTLKNLRAKGGDVRLLPNTGIAPSALDEITLRLKQGWGYIKV